MKWAASQPQRFGLVDLLSTDAAKREDVAAVGNRISGN